MKRSGSSARTTRRRVKQSVEDCNNLLNDFQGIGEYSVSSISNVLSTPHQNTSAVEERSDNQFYLAEEQTQAHSSIKEVKSQSIIQMSDFSSENTDSDIEESDFSTLLANWGTSNNIAHSALTSLLKLLKTHSCFNYLPTDARTLLKTPRSTPTTLVKDGEYVHFGLEDAIRTIVKTLPKVKSNISLYFNIDGIPIFKSSSKQFWPILCSIVDPPSNPKMVGIFCGDKKSSSATEYLSTFVNETLQLCTDGITIGSHKHTINVQGFICDAPARAYILGIKNHTGYFACGKCNIKGSYVSGRVVFNYSICEPRTDESFRNKTNDTHHREVSVIERLPIDMVKSFPFEYMHLVCLGVTRKLLQLWCRGKKSAYRLTASKTTIISSRLLDCRPTTPREFNRKPRSLSELERWKATEFRQFILYLGVTCLTDILDPDCYKHFLCLHVAILIFTSSKLCVTHYDYGNQLLRYFVSSFSGLYGDETVSYNVHGLLHLPEDVKTHGHLDQFSGFKFENELQFIKRLIRGKDKPLQQIHRRLIERQQLDIKVVNT